MLTRHERAGAADHDLPCSLYASPAARSEGKESRMIPNAAPFSLTQPFGVRSQRALLVGLIFVVVLLLALITLPPLASARADALRAHLDTNVQVFANTLTAVENNVQEMQAATRGYILTQQPAFLEQ